MHPIMMIELAKCEIDGKWSMPQGEYSLIQDSESPSGYKFICDVCLKKQKDGIDVLDHWSAL